MTCCRLLTDLDQLVFAVPALEHLVVGGVVVHVAPLDVGDGGEAGDEERYARRHPHEESPLANLNFVQ